MDYVSLEGDADDIAARLLAPHLPAKPLDSISIESDQGLAELVVHLTGRVGRASIEKDELIRFVERNRANLKGDRLKMMDAFVSAAKATDTKFGEYMKYFVDNLKLAFAGRTSELNMRSDRLFWLVFALGHQLADGTISYEQARAKLSRPDVVQRISPHQLIYMVYDYAESLETPQEPPRAMLVMIGECALLGDEPKTVQLVSELLAKHFQEQSRITIVGFLTRAAAYLSNNGIDTTEIRDALTTLNERSRPIADDDF